MSYMHSLKYKESLRKEFSRFVIKLVFSFLLILFLMYTNFYWALGFLLALLIIISLTTKLFNKKNVFAKFIFQAEREYEIGFPGKEAMISLIGFILVFVIMKAFNYAVSFDLSFALLLGLLNVGAANNLASLILWKAKSQYVIYGTTMEFLVLSSIIGALLFMLLGFPYYVAIFIAFGANLFSLLPLNHNFTNLLVTSLLYLLLFV